MYIYVYYTKTLEVNLFAFAYRLFHEDFSSINRALNNQRQGPVDWRKIFMKQSVGKCKQINFQNLCVKSSTFNTLPFVIPE